jgi:hypothetical protein
MASVDICGQFPNFAFLKNKSTSASLGQSAQVNRCTPVPFTARPITAVVVSESAQLQQKPMSFDPYRLFLVLCARCASDLTAISTTQTADCISRMDNSFSDVDL